MSGSRRGFLIIFGSIAICFTLANAEADVELIEQFGLGIAGVTFVQSCDAFPFVQDTSAPTSPFTSFEYSAITSPGEAATATLSGSIAYTISPDGSGIIVHGDADLFGEVLQVGGCPDNPNIFGSAVAEIENSFTVEITGEPMPFTFEGTLGSTIIASGIPTFDNSASSTFSVFSVTESLIFEFIECLPSRPCTGDRESFEVELPPGVYQILLEDKIDVPLVGEASVVSDWTVTIGEIAACDVKWDEPNGGAFATAENWNLAQVPADDGAGCSNARFDLAGAYTVNYGTAALNSMAVRNGNLSLAGDTLSLSGRQNPGGTPPPFAGVRIGTSASLTLNTGTLNTNALDIGDAAGSFVATLILNAASTLNVTGPLRVGGIDSGNLSSSGATVTTGEVFIGGGIATTPSSLIATGGTWTTGSFRVAGQSEGSAEFAGAASISSTEALIGNAPSKLGKVRVRDVGTQWATSGRLSVGSLGRGELDIITGASVSAGETLVGDIGGEDGLLIVEAVVGTARTAFTAAGPVTVGAGGTGSVEVKAGALFRAQQGMIIGESAIADVEVGIESNGLKAALDVTGELAVGKGASGELFIADGGSVTSTRLLIGTGGVGAVSLLEGALKGIGSGPALNVTQDAQVGFDTPGELLMEGAATAEFGSLIVGGGSAANGNVTLRTDSSDAPQLRVLGSTVIGASGTAVVSIRDGATMKVNGGMNIGEALGTGLVEVLTAPGGPTSFLQVTGLVQIGVNLTAQGLLKIVGETLVDTPGGIVLNPTGTLSMPRGATVGSLQLNGGRLVVTRGAGGKQAGNEPARIDGDLTVTSGTISFEADDASAPQLQVTGNAVLAGTLEITFADEEGLAAGNAFQLLSIDGSTTGNFAQFTFPSRTSDFLGNVTIVDGEVQMVVQNPGQPLGSGEGEGEGEGEGCGGCSGKSYPDARSAADWILLLLGISALIGARNFMMKP